MFTSAPTAPTAQPHPPSQPIVFSRPTARPASSPVRDVLRWMRLSSAEQQLLTMLNAASPAPVRDTALLAALGETWHAERLHSRMKHLREKLWPHGLMLLRALNYGYALIEIEMP
jgi:hypothetical protein